MEIILLIIYSAIVWFIFFKKKWLPWNITSQVIVVTIPLGRAVRPNDPNRIESQITRTQ